MRRFDVYFRGRLIGHTAFERGDRSMGVIYGEFFPNGAYHRDMATENSHLSVSLGDAMIRCEGVAIEDCFDEADEIEVAAFGVSCPTYEELFPERADADDWGWQNP
ncbi:MAG TPA: hypothetical protein VGO04_10745 [Ensifer sp.]|jgi:hypothetical protein|uniref:hypothetical protein n=1 Tax=Ensifer sp. TaxID=1872086 RepID=UPI002E156947|nr:hypothetical protein [Ensifer sp.]